MYEITFKAQGEIEKRELYDVDNFTEGHKELARDAIKYRNQMREIELEYPEVLTFEDPIGKKIVNPDATYRTLERAGEKHRDAEYWMKLREEHLPKKIVYSEPEYKDVTLVLAAGSFACESNGDKHTVMVFNRDGSPYTYESLEKPVVKFLGK